MIPRPLQHFAAVYAYRSLGKAAAQLGMSQPALSKSLRQLETQLGVPLFVRHPWGMEATKYAHALTRHGEIIGRQFDALGRDLQALQHSQLGSARLGTNLGAASRLVPDALLALSSHGPGIRVSVIEGLYEQLVGGVVSGTLDLAVTTAPPPGLPPALASKVLFEDPFVVAVSRSHPLVGLAPDADLACLLQYRWILPPDEGMLKPRVADIFRKAGVRLPVSAIETVSILAIVELLCAQPYLCWQSLSVVRSRAVSVHLTWLAHADLMFSRPVACIWRKDSPLSPAAAALLDALVGCSAQLGADGIPEDPVARPALRRKRR